MDGKRRQDIRPGLTVDVVLKQDQRTGKRTRGVVAEILTPSRDVDLLLRLDPNWR